MWWQRRADIFLSARLIEVARLKSIFGEPMFFYKDRPTWEGNQAYDSIRISFSTL